MELIPHNGGNSRIVTMRTDGTDCVRLPGNGEPRYAPDGKQIVFDGHATGSKRYGIWVMRRDGSNARSLADNQREPGRDGDYVVDDYGPD